MTNELTKIGFVGNLISRVLSGEKFKTYRYGNRYAHLEVGDRFIVWDSDADKDVAIGEITEKSLVKFKDLPIKTDGHEEYRSKEEQREIFKIFYGKEIGDDENMLVLKFKLIEKLE